ncbi:MAG: DMT family transporter [Actinobacteria bacterium]|jgi:drug/metabolite transporter (DMT)-like permease|nr:DMT family transporter [Actinomycetota bacterium]NBY83079.1 DMT family transporter [Actinomycetota bacterium]NCA25724.1 DMT family transporter [Actinomycetota bacterium]NCU78155.1 DMT family transporter [Actinomycetota bacterium]NCU96367.1 DMT family transporter [Actinomycetota bacterium]
MRKSWLPAYLALGTVWGCSFIFIELGLEFLTPFGVTFTRCALGAITLLIILKIRKAKLPTQKSTWRKLWVVAMLLNVVPGVLFAFAQQYITSVLAGIINATTPLMTLVFILLLFREEKLKPEQIIGLLVGALGVMTVVGVWKELGDNQLIGVIALLLAVSCYGASYPYSTRNVVPLGLRPEALATGQLIMATLTLLPLFIFNGVLGNAPRIESAIAMLLLGVFGSGFAYIWNFYITASAGSAIASTVTYLTPVVAVVIGWLYLGEEVFWHEIIGALIVITGALISQGRLNRLIIFK